uniref:Uncharacterized protein n=1 Tax=Anguilla anguilla TaxID=7936 RepID=A0A0E9W2V8_ANGAN
MGEALVYIHCRCGFSM